MKLFEFLQHIGRYRVLVNSRDIEKDAIKSRHIADHAILSRHLSDKCIDDLRKFLSLEDLASALTGMSDYYTKEEIDALLQDIDVDIDLSGFYTKHEVDLLLRTLKQGRFEAVAELPEASVLTLFTIYLVPSTNSQQANVKDEFITVQDQDGNYRWEQIGSTTIDLSGYLKTKDFFSTLDNIPAKTTYKKDDNGEDTDVVDKYGWDAVEKLLSWLDTKYQAKGDYLTEHQSLDGKQDKIEDLADIKSGAAAGATAYQKPEGGIPESDLAQALQNKIDSMPSDATVGQKANKVTWAEGQSKQDELVILASDGDIKASGKKLSHLLLLAELATKINSEIPAETVYKKDDQGNPTNEIETLGWDKITKLKQYLDKLYLAKNTTIPAAQVQSDWNASEGMGAILNKPTIPDAQIQSDWNQSDDSKKDFIKNKPTIPAAQVQSDWNETDTSKKSFIKNKPTIPAAQVQSDWDATDGMGVILNKPTIPAAQIQSDWDETDSSKKSFIQNKPNISSKADKMGIVSASGTTLTAAVGNYYRFDQDVNDLTITLPSMSPNSATLESVMIFFTAGNDPDIRIASAANQQISKFVGYDIVSGVSYELNCMWNGAKWIVAYGVIG